MEYINGEFIMAGCEPDDPHIIRTAEDCVRLIHSAGFLPLFSNTISGFSVEEHTLASQWWTDDPETDPWVWRQILSSDPAIAYGKFFNRTAGFISKDFFPTFANYRRNGYDFDALFEDELASYRSKKIMDVFELAEEAVGKAIMSSEIKQLAGFSKEGGEKDFDGVITDLQMQTYLIMGDFQQKKNKKGQSYGWHIAVMETPETKWGREFVTSEYKTDPAESWKKIVARMKEGYPDVADELVWKMLGIKYPSVEAKPATKAKQKTALPWPENLLRAMEAAAVKAEERRKAQATEMEVSGVKANPPVDTPPFTLPDHLTADQMAGLIHAIATLKDNEKKAIRLRFEEQRTIKGTADEFGLTGSRIQQIIAKALRKLRHPSRIALIVEGLEGSREKKERHKADIQNAKDKGDQERLLGLVKILEAGLSVRAGHCLVRSGLTTLGDVAKLADEDPVALLQIRNLGRGSLLEVIEKLEEYGVDCYEVRKACGFGIERREDIVELEPSIRLYNILIRAGLDTVSKVEKAIQEQPMNLLRLDGLGKKTAAELLEKMEKAGVDCSPVREEAKWLGWEL